MRLTLAGGLAGMGLVCAGAETSGKVWAQRVLRRWIAVGLIGWIGLVGLVLAADGIGQGLFPDSPVLTFVTFQHGARDVFRLGAYDVRGGRLVRFGQPAEEDQVLARDVAGHPAIVAARRKQTQLLTVRDPATGELRQLSTDDQGGSNWSTDGRYYAFEVRSRYQWTILLLDTVDGHTVEVAPGPGNDRLPVWWP